MRIYETQTITRETNVCTEIRCDICGAKEDTPEWIDSWNSSNFNETKVTIKQKEGTSYPDGGQGTEYIVDMCPVCFKDRLIPWIKSQGGHVEEKDWCC